MAAVAAVSLAESPHIEHNGANQLQLRVGSSFSDETKPGKAELSAHGLLTAQQQQLSESHAREERLAAEIADLKKSCDELVKELCHSRQAQTRHVSEKEREEKKRDAVIKLLQKELSEQRLGFVLLHQETHSIGKGLIAKTVKSMKDAVLIQRMFTEGTELLHARAALSSELASKNEANAALVRKTTAYAAAAAGAAKRIDIQEREHARLSAVVTEARSQRQIAVDEAAARATASETTTRALHRELDGTRARADKLADKVDALTKTVEIVHRERDSSRASAVEEVRRLKKIITARIQAAKEADARVEKYKRQLQASLGGKVQPVPPMAARVRQMLDDAEDAGALLRVREASLDKKQADLVEQRSKLELARVQRLKLAVEIQGLKCAASDAKTERDHAVGERDGLVRAALQARRERDTAVSQRQATLAGIASLRRNVCELEQRVIFGGLPQLPMRIPGSTYGNPAGRIGKGDDDEPISVAEALIVIKRVIQQHDAIVASQQKAESIPLNKK